MRVRFLWWRSTGADTASQHRHMMGVPLGAGRYLIQPTSTTQTLPDTPDWTNAFTCWAVLGICLRISKWTNMAARLTTFCYISKIVHWNMFLKTFWARSKPCSWLVSQTQHGATRMHCTASYIDNEWEPGVLWISAIRVALILPNAGISIAESVHRSDKMWFISR